MHILILTRTTLFFSWHYRCKSATLVSEDTFYQIYAYGSGSQIGKDNENVHEFMFIFFACEIKPKSLFLFTKSSVVEQLFKPHIKQFCR